jgi:aminoglycoside 6'-N-acetyltransferase I
VTQADIKVRHAEAADADQWLRLRAALWPEEDPSGLADDVTRFFQSPGDGQGSEPEAVLVASVGRDLSLVGFAELSRRAYAEGCNTSPVGFLEGWYVEPGYRRHGIGRALVAAAEQWARSLGCREFASDAVAENMLSAAAHKAIGFEEVGLIRCFRKSLTRESDQ